MITFEEFSKFILYWKIFNEGIDRFQKAIVGNRNYLCILYETDWGEAVGMMLDTFIDSHFTEAGADWINYWLFEDIKDKKVWITKPKDMFNDEEKIEYHLNNIEELWDFLLTDKKLYFKNV